MLFITGFNVDMLHCRCRKKDCELTGRELKVNEVEMPLSDH